MNHLLKDKNMFLWDTRYYKLFNSCWSSEREVKKATYPVEFIQIYPCNNLFLKIDRTLTKREHFGRIIVWSFFRFSFFFATAFHANQIFGSVPTNLILMEIIYYIKFIINWAKMSSITMQCLELTNEAERNCDELSIFFCVCLGISILTKQSKLTDGTMK